MKKMIARAFILTTLVLFSAGEANAAESHSTSNLREQDYAYVFEDDPLDAVPQTSDGERIRARRTGQRSFLIRPRAQFVREIFQSVEDL